jgi:hypothetical protein
MSSYEISHDSSCSVIITTRLKAKYVSRAPCVPAPSYGSHAALPRSLRWHKGPKLAVKVTKNDGNQM